MLRRSVLRCLVPAHPLNDPSPTPLRLVISTEDGERVFFLEQDGPDWIVIFHDRVYLARVIGTRQVAEKPFTSKRYRREAT